MIKKYINIIIILTIIISNLLVFFIPNKVYAAYNQVIINANSNNNNGIDAFPQSYQIMLKKLISETGHTNWKFKPFYTDIDWNELTSSSNENTCLRNTIYKTNGTLLCSCGRQGDTGYYCASAKAVNYYLDPRNFLTETTIFQFLDLSNETVISVEDIKEAVKGTYLEGNVNEVSYAEMIYKAAQETGENALSIVVKIFQELGKGTTLPRMIAGTDVTYPNTYNFFNYGASDGEGNIERGLAYAQKAGWSTPEKALVEGAKLISNSYLRVGQNTKYTFKFDIIDDKETGLYTHQYMTNIQDPTNQAQMLFDEYLNNNWLNNKLTFIIPVYKNMPAYVKLPSNLTTNDGELYYISSNYYDVSLRSETNSTSTSIASLKRNTVVLMLEYNVNNSEWSKVKVNGQEGYVSNQYLTHINTQKDEYKVPEQPIEESNAETKPEEKPDTQKPQEGATNIPTVPEEKPSTQVPPASDLEIIETADYKAEGNLLVVKPGLKLSDIKVKYNVTSAKKDGVETNDDILATGMEIVIKNKSYTVVKLGDVSGDGEVDARDSARILRYSIGQYEMNEIQKKSADVSKDSEIDARDSARILRYSINEYEINL